MRVLRYKIERRLSRILAARRVAMRNETPLVSFTFDDVPQSACVSGRAILERYQCRGTYYVCGGLTDVPAAFGKMHSRQELSSLHQGGHELGCHGFGHLDYQRLTRGEIEEDISRNGTFLQDLGCDVTDLNFAYPYGCVSPMVKKLIWRRYRSARGIQKSPNIQHADLALLKAPPLYSCLWNERSLAELIEKSAQRKGWIIFFTHEVTADPDLFGCTPSLLEFAVRKSTESGAFVLPIKEAVGRVVGS